MSGTALALAALAVGLTACGGGGDTTIINKTTTVTESGGTGTDKPSGSGVGETETGVPQELPEEYSGPCRPRFNVPPGGKAGYENLETVEADCEYAHAVATEWSRRYGPDCYQGCRRTINNIGCTYESSEAEIVCLAARTEVRWDIVYLDTGS